MGGRAGVERTWGWTCRPTECRLGSDLGGFLACHGRAKGRAVRLMIAYLKDSLTRLSMGKGDYNG
jgi:hypothetical protein